MTQPRREVLRRSALLASLSLAPRRLLGASPAPTQPYAPGRTLVDIVSLGDAESAAGKITPRDFFEFVQSGVADERTLRWNTERFQEIMLRPRMLADVSALDTTVRLFGATLPAPILLAPTSSNRILHPEGELAVARGADRTGTAYVLSTLSNTPIEQVASATKAPLWFQVYPRPELAHTKDMMRRAEAAGARAHCITVDSPVPGARNREERAGFRLPPELGYPHLTSRFEPGRFSLERVVPIRLVWAEVAELIAHAKVPVLLKGIMTPEDATEALKIGAAGIIVSNHGGRALDTVPATIDVLPGIADTVAGCAPVLMDGGIRRGTDIVKALALGAQAVLIGRPYLHGLTLAGADGVAHIQRLLLRELRMALALLGCTNLAAVTRNVIWRR